jgi:hypothetical protein
MDAYDRELKEKLQKLETIQARLVQHQRITHLGLIWLSILGAGALVLMAYHIIGL